MNNNMVVKLLLGAVVIVSAGYLLISKGYLRVGNPENSQSSWQAVFLTNGQVYFGHLKNQNQQYLVLKDVYYLVVDQQAKLQPVKEVSPEQKEDPKLTLVKLGNELHGPTDELKVNRDHVLFVETMKDDSKVVKAIKDFLDPKPK